MMSSDETEDVLPRDEEMLKTKKDKYKVIALLGKGGYGAVYSVLRQSDSEKFAIKCEKAAAAKKVLLMDCNQDQSRKDDIESWLYMVVEWTSGGLPWRKLKASDRDKVLIYKNEYIDTLGYYAVPDYKFIYYCVQHAATANKIKDNDPIDWDPDRPYFGPVECPGDGKVIDLDVEGGASTKDFSKKNAKEKEQKEKEKENDQSDETRKGKKKKNVTASPNKEKTEIKDVKK
ncbi:hypothetical protein L5515_003547 [Caenorhabditis briggsae]|uniref:Protein kinase domain-containing protein n=2 Tax=Caenorhabditis briggsae TaxID=6238 RepID=A0AAE9JB22_CAEBR|nr:hypothetical protein L5515_003547 [Caenorhabditis briggsae]